VQRYATGGVRLKGAGELYEGSDLTGATENVDSRSNLLQRQPSPCNSAVTRQPTDLGDTSKGNLHRQRLCAPVREEGVRLFERGTVV
jgi:hypothetical protein